MKKETYSISKKNGTIKPFIPIRLTNPYSGKSLTTLAIIDSGADCCTLPSMISLTLGFELSDKYKSKGTTGISGEVLETYTHDMLIEVFDKSRTNIIRQLLVKVNTLVRNDIPPLLGTYMFLEKFNLSLNYLDSTIELYWNEK